MARKGEKRKLIGLVCAKCGGRYYYTTKNTMNNPDKLEFRKFCPRDRSHESFAETKKNLGRNEVKPRK